MENLVEELKKNPDANSSSGKSEHANELLHIKRTRTVKDANGKHDEEFVDVRGRTEIPNPIAMSVLDLLPNYLFDSLGVSLRNLGEQTEESFPDKYRINMVDKERQARIEYVNVKTAEARAIAENPNNEQKILSQ